MLSKVHSSTIKDENMAPGPTATKNKNPGGFHAGSTTEFSKSDSGSSDTPETPVVEGYKELFIRISFCASLAFLVGSGSPQARVTDVLFWTTLVFILVLALLQVVPRVKATKFSRKLNPILIGFTQLISLVFAFEISNQSPVVFMNYAMIATPVTLGNNKYHLIFAKLILIVVYLVHLPSTMVTVLVAIVFGNLEILLHIYAVIRDIKNMVTNDKKEKEGSKQIIQGTPIPEMPKEKNQVALHEQGIISKDDPFVNEDGELIPIKSIKSKNVKTKQIVQFREEVADNDGIKRPLTSVNDADK